MGIVYIIIVLLSICTLYILGKKRYFSDYWYYSFNYSNLTYEQRVQVKRNIIGDNYSRFDSDDTVGAYFSIIGLSILWPISISVFVIIKVLNRIIKEKNKEQ